MGFTDINIDHSLSDYDLSRYMKYIIVSFLLFNKGTLTWPLLMV